MKKGTAMRLTFIALSFLSLIFCGRAFADEPAPGEEVKPVEITLSARKFPTPVMKYRLLPMESELKPGNAATIFLRLPWEEYRYFLEVVPKYDEWTTKPLDDPAWKESQMPLDGSFYRELKRAAFRRDADWEYPIGEQPLSSILLPDAQGARSIMGRGLSAKIRYHLSRGEFDQAREGILVGLANARHLAKTPFFVTQLMGDAIAKMMLDQTQEMIGQSDSPNLYWALSVLPRPFFDLRPSAEFEQVALEMTIPALANLDQPRTPDQWRAVCDELLELSDVFNGVLSNAGEKHEFNKDDLVKYSRATLPTITKISSQAVAEMSDDEAVVRCYMGQYKPLAELNSALLCLPPREALARFVDFDRKAKKGFGPTEKPNSTLLWPFMGSLQAYASIWAVQRQIDALRIVEAIRDYLVTHDGKLPEKLSDLTAVSIPVDPLTDEPFDWKVEKNVGRLSAKKIPGVQYAPTGSLEYVIRVR